MSWLVRSEEVSDPRYGCYPGSRDMEDHLRNGLLILDKPSGPTSHQVTGWVRDMLGLEKAGHAGTLDPKVTGVLVIALQNGTKLMPALMRDDKEYVAVMRLHGDVSGEELEEVMEEFTGTITQKPPRKSAVKRVERERTVHEMEMIERDGEGVLLRIDCEAGTYIRKLIDDMGSEMGGAHMEELRRTRSGHFTEAEVVTLHDLKDAFEVWRERGEEDLLRETVMPIERAADGLGKVVIKDTAVDAVCNGAPLATGGLTRIEEGIEAGELAAVFSGKGELVALGEADATSEEMLEEDRVAVKTDRVLMERGTYPSSWKS